MSRWSGQCHDGCCQLSPGPGLRAECDTELIWPPEADAEAELRPGLPGPGPRLQSLVWSRPESQPRPGQAQPLEAVWSPGCSQPLTTQTTDLVVEDGILMLSAQIILILTMLMAANTLTALIQTFTSSPETFNKAQIMHHVINVRPCVNIQSSHTRH